MSDAPNPAALAARSRVRADDTEEVEAEVETVLGRLEALSDLPVTEHVAVFEGVQQRLAEILGNVDDA
jgi:hypothetical protein